MFGYVIQAFSYNVANLNTMHSFTKVNRQLYQNQDIYLFYTFGTEANEYLFHYKYGQLA